MKAYAESDLQVLKEEVEKEISRLEDAARKSKPIDYPSAIRLRAKMDANKQFLNLITTLEECRKK